VAEESSIEFYRVLSQNRDEDLRELTQFERREDITTYEPVLREIMCLFGQAINTSLERTMAKYLHNELREEWELEKVSQLLSQNNAAERPFGVVKAYLDVYKTMKLSTLANFSLAITNGSHKPAGTIGKTQKTKLRVPKPAGIALTSPERLKLAITKVCGTRLVQTGKVTALLREKCAGDTARADARRKAHTQADLEKKSRAHLRKGVTFNQVHRTPTHSSSRSSTNPIVPFEP
jgi:hypothetical protein